MDRHALGEMKYPLYGFITVIYSCQAAIIMWISLIRRKRFLRTFST